MATERLRLRSSDFRRERESMWVELEALVAKADRHGMRELTASEVERLPALYRQAVSSLSVARAISLDQGMLAYLEALVARAYFTVYGVKPRPKRALVRFFTHDFPQAVRATKVALFVSIAVMLAGIVIGTQVSGPEYYSEIVPPELAGGRDHTASDEELRQILYHGRETEDSDLAVFSAFLFSHNTKIGFFCLALGFALGLPTLFLLFYNGLLLGAMAGLYAQRGMGAEFWGWVLPHGVTELLAVCLCGAGGLAIAWSLIRAGRYKRLTELFLTGKRIGLIALGATCLFFLAGLIEGVFRQRVQELTIRYGVIFLSLLLWALYFSLANKRKP